MSLFKFPFTFVAGTKAKAEEVNKNFEAAEEEINDNLRPGTHESGDLKATARAAAPEGWLLCEGQAISRATYADLFKAIGTSYGAGDKATTFNVPDLRGRVAVGVDGAAGRLSANDSLGKSGGHEKLATHTHGPGSLATGLESAQHTHGLGWEVALNNIGGPSLANIVVQGGFTHTTFGEESHYHNVVSGSTASAGSGSGENMPPFQIVNWLIKV
jgi:microcystin-dependent protein